MVLIGCRPAGRLTEQHDIFFGIASELKELVPAMKASWPEAKGQIHIDAWREVTQVGDHSIHVIPKEKQKAKGPEHLFFINLGGYKHNEFEEYHYKLLSVGKDSAEAIKASKATAFFKHTGIKDKGGASHVDDKYGIDTDDLFKVEDVLDDAWKRSFALEIVPAKDKPEDALHIGYVPVKSLL